MLNSILGGQSQDSYIRSLNYLNKDFSGSSTSIPIRIFKKAVEIFMHSLVYDKELAFSCEKCPNPLKVGEREEDFENIFECHVIDGINMGNIEKPKKGLSVIIFDEAKVENVLVKGAEAVDRTAISTPKMRQLLKILIDSLFDKHILKETLSQWQKS